MTNNQLHLLYKVDIGYDNIACFGNNTLIVPILCLCINIKGCSPVIIIELKLIYKKIYC